MKCSATSSGNSSGSPARRPRRRDKHCLAAPPPVPAAKPPLLAGAQQSGGLLWNSLPLRQLSWRNWHPSAGDRPQGRWRGCADDRFLWQRRTVCATGPPVGDGRCGLPRQCAHWLAMTKPGHFRRRGRPLDDPFFRFDPMARGVEGAAPYGVNPPSSAVGVGPWTTRFPFRYLGTGRRGRRPLRFFRRRGAH
jgi:hypothetical protein